MIRPLTVAGAAQAGPTMFGGTSLLPVELRYVNHTASTNGAILRAFQVHPSTIVGSMDAPSTTDQIAERVERLLLRHAELQRTNALLASQVASLTQERDSLRSRLSAARARVDALLERPPTAPSPQHAERNKTRCRSCSKATSCPAPKGTSQGCWKRWSV